MIENKRQYEITKQKLKEFQSAVKMYKAQPKPTTRNEELRFKAHIDSLESFIEEFEEDIANYEAHAN